MSLGIEITVKGDGGEVPGRVLAVLRPERLNPVVGRAGANTVSKHLRELNRTRANALGGRRTNYYAGAARATSFRIEGDEVVVSINHVGIRQRFFGGTIRPKSAKFLTIPAIPEAHGKRAREFDGLSFAIMGGKPALVRKTATQVASRVTRRSSRRGVGTTGAAAAASGGGVQVVFWLRRSVTQRPDPSVLPTRQVLGAEITKAVTATVDRAARRGGRQP